MIVVRSTIDRLALDNEVFDNPYNTKQSSTGAARLLTMTDGISSFPMILDKTLLPREIPPLQGVREICAGAYMSPQRPLPVHRACGFMMLHAKRCLSRENASKRSPFTNASLSQMPGVIPGQSSMTGYFIIQH